MERFSKKSQGSLHLEDLVTCYGRIGVERALEFLKEQQQSTNQFSIKWDGAPAVVFGWHPITEQFFVSTKSYFNKTSIYYTETVDTGRPEVDAILNECFSLQDIIPAGKVYQGDVLFHGDLDLIEHNGTSYVVAHANTIAYCVPTGTKTAKEWTSARIGIAVHSEIRNGVTEPADLSEFKKVPEIYIPEQTHIKSTLSARTSARLKQSIAVVESFKDKVPDYVFALVQEEQEMFNKYLKNRGDLTNFHDEIGSFIAEQNELRIAGIKTESIRKRYTESANDLYKRIQENHKNVWRIMAIHSQIQRAKDALILDLQESTTGIECFLINKYQQLVTETNDGNIGHEGFMIESGPLQGVKLVDRELFTKVNSSDIFAKGWNTNRR